MCFSTRLQSTRKSSGMTQKDFANLLEITERGYRSYENGSRHPNFDKLIQISKILNVSTDYLLGLTDNPNSHKA